MSSTKDTKPVPYVGTFLHNLTLIFITLKLTSYINWSWFWVLSPILGQFILLIVLYSAIGLANTAK